LEIAAIKTAVGLGIVHIDTAEIYAAGHTEDLVGQAIKDFDRKKLFLVSKVYAQNLHRDGISKAIKGSLARLGTDYLDLYLMHRYPGDTMLEECVQAMNEIVDKGLTKYIGISNFNLEHTKQTHRLSKHPIVATQVHYNLQFREPEQTGLLDYCQNNDIMLIAWRPVNKGALNKSGTNITTSGIPLLDQLCEKYKKTPAQIAINRLINQPNVVTVSKTTMVEHLKENLGALDWQMEKEDVEKLRKGFPGQRFISDTVPLA
jgi:diketogulonate reductase-like aldo/keto reductase